MLLADLGFHWPSLHRCSWMAGESRCWTNFLLSIWNKVKIDLFLFHCNICYWIHYKESIFSFCLKILSSMRFSSSHSRQNQRRNMPPNSSESYYFSAKQVIQILTHWGRIHQVTSSLGTLLQESNPQALGQECNDLTTRSQRQAKITSKHWYLLPWNDHSMEIKNSWMTKYK